MVQRASEGWAASSTWVTDLHQLTWDPEAHATFNVFVQLSAKATAIWGICDAVSENSGHKARFLLK